MTTKERNTKLSVMEPEVTPLASRLPQWKVGGGNRNESACGDITTVIFGNPGMIRELRKLFSARGFASSCGDAPGQMNFGNYCQDHD